MDNLNTNFYNDPYQQERLEFVTKYLKDRGFDAEVGILDKPREQKDYEALINQQYIDSNYIELTEEQQKYVDEVKAEIFKYIETLIFKGFLSNKIKIDDTVLTFKTITEAEFSLIDHYLTDFDINSDKNIKTNALFLACSLYKINSESILHSKFECFDTLVNFFCELDTQTYTKLLELINNLQEIYNKLIPFVELYAYDEYSRFNWKTIGDNLNTFKLSGIYGIENIPLNHAQKLWIYFNKFEDENENHELYYQLASLQVSGINGAFGKSIQENISKMKEEKSLSRQRELLFLEHISEDNFYNFSDTKTKEGLVEELEKQISGKKDYHDLVIESDLVFKDAIAQFDKLVSERVNKENTFKGVYAIPVMSSTREVTLEEINKIQKQEANKINVMRENFEAQDVRSRTFEELQGAHAKTVIPNKFKQILAQQTELDQNINKNVSVNPDINGIGSSSKEIDLNIIEPQNNKTQTTAPPVFIRNKPNRNDQVINNIKNRNKR